MIIRYISLIPIISLFMGILSSLTVKAQNAYIEKTTYNFYGAYIDINFAFHNTDISQIPGVPNCCEQFEEGAGGGVSAGLFIERAVIPHLILGAKAGIQTFGARFEETEYELIGSGLEPTRAEIRHVISSDMFFVSAEPYVGYMVFDNFYVIGGFGAALSVKSSYSQQETLISPESGSFENGRRIRNDLSGDIEDMNAPFLYLTGAVRYDISLDEKGYFYLSPEISGLYGLNSVLKNDNWNISALKVGLGVKYAPAKGLSNPLNPTR